MNARLRPYQQEAVKHVISTHLATLVQSPVATGKTRVFAELTRKWTAAGKRVLVLAHRAELLTQAAAEIEALGVKTGTIRAGMPHLEDASAMVQVASVQTLCRRKPRRWPAAEVIVIDEAHHAPAKSYRKILDRYPQAQRVGFTATPVFGGDTRLSTLADCFENVYTTIQPAAAVASGAIAPVTGRVWVPRGPDLRSVRRVGGDFDQAQLGEAMSKRHIVGDIVRRWKARAKGASTILFAATRSQSAKMVKAFRKAGVRAESLDGTSRPEVRAATLARFQAGEFPVLCNVGLFTEGTNVERVKCIILARPTLSLGLYTQMVGRGRRVWNGQTCVIHDHAGLIGTHGHPDQHRDWALGVKAEKPAPMVVCPVCHEVRALSVERCPKGCTKKGTAHDDPAWILRSYEYDLEQFAAMRSGQIEQARKLYVEDGLGTVDVARTLHVSPSLVYGWGVSGGWVRQLRRRTEVVDWAIRDLYAVEKLSAADVATVLDVSENTVLRLAKREGFVRSPSELSRALVDPAKEKEARRLYVRGLSCEKVGSRIGLSGGVVKRWGRQGGWLRTRSEANAIRTRRSFGPYGPRR